MTVFLSFSLSRSVSVHVVTCLVALLNEAAAAFWPSQRVLES